MKKFLLNISYSALLILGLLFGGCSSSTTPNGGNNNIDTEVPIEPVTGTSADCVNGLADDMYSCENIDLLARITPQQLFGERLNDIWGWTDRQTGKEYALVGLTDRVTFVDISTPAEPIVLGTLPEIGAAAKHKVRLHHDEEEGEGKSSAWRDIKVYDNHAFVVTDGQPHGLQIFDLTRLRDVTDTQVIFREDAHFTEFGNAHNIAINEETGFGYVVGSNQVGGGLYILDLKNPEAPQVVGSHADASVGASAPGYVHDTQCVVYSGPDADYAGKEVCFNASETHFVIADVSNKSATATISKSTYPGNTYAHQGWLTEDHQYFLLDDELDEQNAGIPTTTYIWDVRDLDNPQLIGTHESQNLSIDHNQYVKGNFSYQANYTTGLRILDVSNIASATLTEVAFFDTFPPGDGPNFEGAWSNYPFFDSGVIIVSDINSGLFILSANIP